MANSFSDHSFSKAFTNEEDKRIAVILSLVRSEFFDEFSSVMADQVFWYAFLEVKHTPFTDEVGRANLSQMYPQLYPP
jgi:hypothetical protein